MPGGTPAKICLYTHTEAVRERERAGGGGGRERENERGKSRSNGEDRGVASVRIYAGPGYGENNPMSENRERGSATMARGVAELCNSARLARARLLTRGYKMILTA